MSVGHSALILGPSGAGKSTVIRTALRHEGSGVMLMAPGSVEWNSYVEFADREGYFLGAFDDPEFMPHAGLTKVEGLTAMMKVAIALHKKCADAIAADEPLPYAVLGVDRMDGAAQLAVNIMLKTCGLKEAPPAQSPDGARYYTGLKNLMHQLMRPLMKCRELGMHLIVTSHVYEREVKPTAMAETTGMAYLPLMPGSFKEELPGYFDLCFYAGVDKQGTILSEDHNDPKHPRHFVRWIPSGKSPSKSRLGSIADRDKLPNEWPVLRPLLDAALDRRGGDV